MGVRTTQGSSRSEVAANLADAMLCPGGWYVSTVTETLVSGGR